MLAAIEFQNQTPFQADEIDDIVAEWKLPAKLKIREAPVSQPSPDELLLFGLASPKVSGSLAILVGHKVPPHP
jgi:hypothetical protein